MSAAALPRPSADLGALEQVEAEGYRDLWAGASLATAAALGLGWGRVDGAECRVASGVPGHRLLNHVSCAGDGLDVATVRALYAAAGTSFVVGASSLAPGLQASLRAAGLVERNRWAKFVRTNAGVPSRAVSDLAVRRAGADDAVAIGDLVASAFELPAAGGGLFAAAVGRPGWTWFAASTRAGGPPLACAALRVDCGIGWLAFAATDPRFRGRGAHAALLAARVGAAREAGCGLVMIEAASGADGGPSASWRNIERAGFQRAYVRTNFGPI